MFSSLSSFIPNSLLSSQQQQQQQQQGGQGQNESKRRDSTSESDDEDEKRPPQRRDSIADSGVGSPVGSRKRRNKAEITTETFIIVRPPPSKSNHPLNLQLQMVLPSSTAARDRLARRSIDFSNANESSETLPDSVGGAALERTPSTRSNRSNTDSVYSSISSSGSMTSLSSSSGSQRRIIPLYNLSAHNVMTNTILDAGTDAKVARFYKRGLEIIGLGFLEPIEVWNGAELWPVNSRGSDLYGPAASQVPMTPPKNPSPPLSGTPTPVPTPAPTPAPTGAKKLFGKLFKDKKKEAPPTIAAAIIPPTLIPTPPVGGPALIVTPSVVVEPMLQPAVLGIQPQLRSAAYPPTGRPTAYVWIVRKWIKGSGDGWLGGLGNATDSLGGALGMNTLGAGGGKRKDGEVEVRVEWVRGKKSHRKKKPPVTTAGLADEDSRRHSIAALPKLNVPEPGAARNSRRHSMIPDRPSNSSISSYGSNSQTPVNAQPPNTSSQLSTQSQDATPTSSALLSRHLSVSGASPSKKDKRQSLSANALGRPSTADAAGERLRSASANAAAPNAPKRSDTASTTSSGGHLRAATIDVSGGSSSPVMPPSVLTETSESPDDGADSESDPEDSETPWNCILHVEGGPVVRKGNAIHIDLSDTEKDKGRVANGGAARPGEGGKDKPHHQHHHNVLHRRKDSVAPQEGEPTHLKVRLASLAPAPHHPKIVAQIKTPYPLPDVSVEYGATRKRGANKWSPPAGTSGPATNADVKGLVLTCEELKDVLSCTGMWLVVRENFGGLATKTRKGDGWNIRG